MDSWKNNLNNFMRKYEKKFTSCVLVGSGVYSGKLREDSDIDLIVIIDSMDEWKFACEEFLDSFQKEFYEETVESYNKGNSQYFCLKFYFEGREYSVDFIFEKEIKNMIKVYSNINEPYKEIHKISNLPQNNVYMFAWGAESFKRKKVNQKLDYSYIINCPLYINEGNIFYGIFLNKLFTGYEFVWGKLGRESFSLLVNTSCEKILKINKSSNFIDLIKSLTRYSRFSKDYIELLKKKIELKWLKLIMN